MSGNSHSPREFGLAKITEQDWILEVFSTHHFFFIVLGYICLDVLLFYILYFSCSHSAKEYEETALISPFLNFQYFYYSNYFYPSLLIYLHVIYVIYLLALSWYFYLLYFGGALTLCLHLFFISPWDQ